MSKIDRVMRICGCNRLDAHAYLLAEEGDVMEAAVSYFVDSFVGPLRPVWWAK